MHESKVCTGCKAVLAPDSAESLCPQCLSATTPHTIPLGTHEAPTRLSEEFPFALGEPVSEPDLRGTSGRYSQIGEHSRGGMGRILLVHDHTIGRDVALKELLP